jgi:hypothetical protein
MTLLTCAAVRRRLQAFYDRELPVRELIAIESHVQDCPPCTRDLREIQSVGEALRVAAAPGPADDWTGLQSGVISRMRAEAYESWAARSMRLFEDMHLVWIGLASTTATLICALTVLSMLHFASPERDDSLAGIITVMAVPAAELNAGRLEGGLFVPRDQAAYGALEWSMLEEPDLVLALSGVVTRQSRGGGLQVLTDEHDRQEVAALVSALARGRLEPAQFGRARVAVNLVWLVAHTTVKAKTGA